MAIDPGTWLTLGQIGSSFLGGKMEPQPQQMQSFGGPAVNDAMGTANNKLSDFDNFYQQYLQEPVSLPSAYVQQPGGYSGPNLPMSFGLSGSDPALSDPSLLTQGSPFDFGPTSRPPSRVTGGQGRPAVSNPDAPGDPLKEEALQQDEAIRALKLMGFKQPPRQY